MPTIYKVCKNCKTGVIEVIIFNHGSVDGSVGLLIGSVGPSILHRGCWKDWPEMLHRYSWSPEDES